MTSPQTPTAPASEPTRWRRWFAEFLGTGLLVAVVVGSGIAAQRLSAGDVGLQLLQNSTTTAFGLTVLIMIFGPVSGAHLNPVVSLADWWLGRRSNRGLSAGELAGYVAVQCAGGVSGALLANAMFEVDAAMSTTDRTGNGLLVGEVVATAGLVLVIFALAASGRGALTAPAVGAYIGAAYWFTSSTSFANPAVAVGRMFTDTFTGIDPSSVPAFVAAQAVGGVVGILLVLALFPTTAHPETAYLTQPPHQVPADSAARREVPVPSATTTATAATIVSTTNNAG